jgi:hypothetical protein
VRGEGAASLVRGQSNRRHLLRIVSCAFGLFTTQSQRLGRLAQRGRRLLAVGNQRGCRGRNAARWATRLSTWSRSRSSFAVA